MNDPNDQGDQNDLNPPDAEEPQAGEPVDGPGQQPDGGSGGGRRSDSGRRRTAIIAAVSVLVAAILGVGAYAAVKLIGGGPQPATALPASTMAFVSVDLDPSAKQKVAAIRTLHKVPDLKKRLDLQSTDDVRKYVFDKAVKHSRCDRLDFDKDVKPWLGDRFALGAVDLGDSKPAPVAALQISDKAKAKKGIEKIIACGHPSHFGFALEDDYALISDSDTHARAIADEADKHPMSDDATYKKWNDEVGDRGELNFYVTPKATSYLLRDLASDLGSGARSASETLNGFKGLAGTVRFEGGGVELSMAAGGLKSVGGTRSVGDEVGRLPSSTALAVGFGVPTDYVEKQLHVLTGDDAQGMARQFEVQTGLTLPGDLQTLLGKVLVLSVGDHAPGDLVKAPEPRDVQAAVTVNGDAEKITGLLEKLQQHLGVQLSAMGLDVGHSGDRVTVATGSDYGSSILDGGKLGDSDTFRDVIPHADKATGLLYLDIDTAWRDAVVETVRHEVGDSEADSVDADTAPLKAFGVSTWTDGDVSHALVRLTTK